MAQLAEQLELVVEASAGAWAQVRAVNGWRGWVDSRLLYRR
jgi:SH3-like domain-containing protein